MTATPKLSAAYFSALLAWPVWCLFLIFTGMILHLEDQQLVWGWPLPNGWQLAYQHLTLLVVVAGALTGALTVSTILQTRKRKQFGNWLEWISLHLFIFAGIWIILPFSMAPYWSWLLGIVLFAGVGFLSASSYSRTSDSPKKYYFSARDAIPDTILISLPLLAGLGLSREIDVLPGSSTLLPSILLYSLYALIQLSVFLLIPATRMQKMGFSRTAIVFGCAMVFSMVHWPNPLLMAVTGMAMLVWSYQFIKGRSILALALIMGMAATGFDLMLPRPWSWDMRIGPDYTEKRAEYVLEAESLQQK